MNTDPASLAQFTNFVLIAVAILVGIAQVIQVFRRSPPLEAQFATKDEVDATRAEIDGRIAELRAETDERLTGLSRKLDNQRAEILSKLDANNALAETRVSGVHKRINRSNASLARLIGAFAARQGIEIALPTEDEA